MKQFINNQNYCWSISFSTDKSINDLHAIDGKDALFFHAHTGPIPIWIYFDLKPGFIRTSFDMSNQRQVKTKSGNIILQLTYVNFKKLSLTPTDVQNYGWIWSCGVNFLHTDHSCLYLCVCKINKCPNKLITEQHRQ